MGESAQVGSIAAIEDFRRALVQFVQHTAHSLCEMEIEIRRAYDWLTDEQLKFWQAEFQRTGRALLEAKTELQNAQTSRRMDDYTPSCIQERKKVERIRQQQELAQAKIQAVRRWGQVVAREIDEFKIRAAQLSTMLEADVPSALATLDRILLTLDQYVRLAAPALAPTEAPSREKSVMRIDDQDPSASVAGAMDAEPIDDADDQSEANHT